MRYHFGACVLDTACRELSRAGQVVPIEPKAYQVLVYLVEHRHRVVTRAELLEHVWPGTFVEDGAVTRCVRALRQAVGDSPAEQRAIQTRRGHGYRFLAKVDAYDGEATVAEPGTVTSAADPATETMPNLTGAILAVEAPEPSGEYKPVTVVCGVFEPDPQTRLTLDERHALLDAVARLVDAVVPAYGGVAQELASDRVVVIFGAPAVQEEHARRAVLAALALQERWLEFAPPGDARSTVLPLRLGLDSGLVIAGGPSGGRRSAVVGEPPGQAAALALRADRGTVVVSGATAALLRDWISLEELPSALGAAHGDSAAYQVAARRPHGVPRGRRGDRERSPFVGRAEELVLLRGRLARAIAGQGSIVEVVGQAGLGKSRLLAEFRRSITARVTYLAARCHSHASTTPYAPIGDLIAQLCGVADSDTPEQRLGMLRAHLADADLEPATWAWAFLDLLGLHGAASQRPPLNPEALRARTFTALHQLLLHQSRRQPLVIEVDDLHWVDATSDAYLAELVTRLAAAPVLLLASYRPGHRPGWTPSSIATQIALGPLSPEDSVRIIQGGAGRSEIAPAVTDRIVDRARGNPFFLEELSQAVREGGAGEASVPGTVQTIVAARLDRLPPVAKHLVQVAAVIGSDAPASLLQALAAMDDDTLGESLGHLQAAEVLFESRRLPEAVYTFTHVLIQDVAYQAVVRPARRELHARLVELWTTQFPDSAARQPALLAQHAAAAGLTEQAVSHWEQAGQQALEHSASVEAIHHFTAGLALLDALPPGPERRQRELTWRLALGNALIAAKGYAAPDVEQNYAQALALCRELPETPELCAALVGLETFCFARGELSTARDLAQQCLALSVRHPDAVRLQQAHQAMGRTVLFLGEPVLARTLLEQAIALDEHDRYRQEVAHYGTAPGIASRVWASVAQWLAGDADQAEGTRRSALELSAALGHPHSRAYALAVSGLIPQFSDDVAAAEANADTLMALTSEHGFAFWGAVGTIWRGSAWVARGRTDDGIAEMERGLASWRAMGAVLVEPYFLALIAKAHGDAGRATQGLALLDEATAVAARTGERWWAAEIVRLRGELTLASGRPRRRAEAAACFREAVSIAGQQRARGLLGRAESSLGRLGS